MNSKNDIISRSQASIRLIEASYQMFANEVDDLALLAVIGSVLTGAFEELDIQSMKADEEHPLNDFFDLEKDAFSRWFNFLKHGSRGPRSPGDEFDFSFLGDGPARDEKVFALIYQAALYHISAYEASSELLDNILLTGNLLWGYEDEEWKADELALVRKTIRKIAGLWYSRHETALENDVDLAKAAINVKEIYAGPATELLSTAIKRPVRNRKSRLTK